LNEKGFSQFVSDEVHNTADDQRQQVVVDLLLQNQKKSRRIKAVRGFMVILLWCVA